MIFQILGGRSNGWSSSSRLHNNNQPEQRNGRRVNRAHWSGHREDKILKSESELFYAEFFLEEVDVINPENQTWRQKGESKWVHLAYHA